MSAGRRRGPARHRRVSSGTVTDVRAANPPAGVCQGEPGQEGRPQLPPAAAPGPRDQGWHVPSLPGEREAKAHPLPALTGAPQSESETEKKPKQTTTQNLIRDLGWFLFSSPRLVILSRVMIQKSNEADVCEKKQAAPLLLEDF